MYHVDPVGLLVASDCYGQFKLVSVFYFWSTKGVVRVGASFVSFGFRFARNKSPSGSQDVVSG